MAWRGDQKDIRAEEQLLGEELYQRARPTIAAYIERLQRAEAPEDFFALHLDLFKEFAARQRAAAETLPGHRARVAGEIRRLAAVEPKPVRDLEDAGRFKERVRRQEYVVRGLQHALRVVADGIAWKALDYNRAAVTVLGRGVRVGRLAGGAGFKAEVAALGSLWEDEHLFAIHNDITNCLRHGDLTIIDFSSPKRVNLGEVKVRSLSSAREQMRRIDEVVGLLNTGAFPAAPRELPTRIVQVAAPYETYLEDLHRAVSEARLSRFAWARPHQAITVGAVDYRIPDRDGRAERELEAVRRGLGWRARGDGFVWVSAQRRIRDRGFVPPSFAPLSIYPFPPADVADLILGYLDTIVYLDIAKLEEAISAAGLQASVARTPEPFLQVTDGPYTITVPGYLREMMMNELMTPKSLVAAIQTMLAFAREPNASRERVLITFPDEAGTWKPLPMGPS